MLVIALLTLTLIQESKPDKQPDPKDAFRKIAVDFDKTYRACMARYSSSKTTADQQDAANENFSDMTQWIRKHNRTKIEFECVFVDLQRHDENGYVANLAINDKSLAMFAPAFKKPLKSKQVISIPVEPELREQLQKGTKVTINAELECGLFLVTENPQGNYGPKVGQEPNTLFYVVLETKNTPGIPRFSRDNAQASSREDYNASFVMNDITMRIDTEDSKKAQVKKSK
jgi:hypothetical protein